MKTTTAGAIGGLVAGAITSGVMLIGRDTGLLHKSLSHDAQDWLDRTFDTRDKFGDDGTELIEQVGHYAASAGFGSAYGAFRPYVPFVPGVFVGALFGAGIYAFGVAGVLPELGVTEGERRAPPEIVRERFITHLLYGAIIGVVTDVLKDRSHRTTKVKASIAPA